MTTARLWTVVELDPAPPLRPAPVLPDPAATRPRPAPPRPGAGAARTRDVHGPLGGAVPHERNVRVATYVDR